MILLCLVKKQSVSNSNRETVKNNYILSPFLSKNLEENVGGGV